MGWKLQWLSVKTIKTSVAAVVTLLMLIGRSSYCEDQPRSDRSALKVLVEFSCKQIKVVYFQCLVCIISVVNVNSEKCPLQLHHRAEVDTFKLLLFEDIQLTITED